jgi:hypothetical protein
MIHEKRDSIVAFFVHRRPLLLPLLYKLMVELDE